MFSEDGRYLGSKRYNEQAEFERLELKKRDKLGIHPETIFSPEKAISVYDNLYSSPAAPTPQEQLYQQIKHGIPENEALPRPRRTFRKPKRR